MKLSSETRRLASQIAFAVFYQVTDHGRRLELEKLLLAFAQEIQRSAIEG